MEFYCPIYSWPRAQPIYAKPRFSIFGRQKKKEGRETRRHQRGSFSHLCLSLTNAHTSRARRNVISFSLRDINTRNQTRKGNQCETTSPPELCRNHHLGGKISGERERFHDLIAHCAHKKREGRKIFHWSVSQRLKCFSSFTYSSLSLFCNPICTRAEKRLTTVIIPLFAPSYFVIRGKSPLFWGN